MPFLRRETGLIDRATIIFALEFGTYPQFVDEEGALNARCTAFTHSETIDMLVIFICKSAILLSSIPACCINKSSGYSCVLRGYIRNSVYIARDLKCKTQPVKQNHM